MLSLFGPQETSEAGSSGRFVASIPRAWLVLDMEARKEIVGNAVARGRSVLGMEKRLGEAADDAGCAVDVMWMDRAGL